MTVGALLLALFGNVINIDDFVFLSIIGWVAGMVVIGFGLPRALAFWAPVASLFLMVPLPRFVIGTGERSDMVFDFSNPALWGRRTSCATPRRLRSRKGRRRIR